MQYRRNGHGGRGFIPGGSEKSVGKYLFHVTQPGLYREDGVYREDGAFVRQNGRVKAFATKLFT